MHMFRVISTAAVCLTLSVLSAAPVYAQAITPADAGTLSVRVRPVNADVMVDGERWVSSDTDGRLVLQLTEGHHTIEIRAQGYHRFSTIVDVRRGEILPLNVSLSAAMTEAAAAPTSRASVSPISVQTADNGFAISPDFRVTELNHRTAGFAGAYGGRVFDRRLLLGVGGYWQTNSSSDARMAYGGAVVEWRVWTDRAIGFTAHGLAGFGAARFNRSFAFDRRMFPNGEDMRGRGRDEGFFVAEPEAQVVARFGSHLHVHAGVGYRVTSARVDDLNGVSGSISIQFGR